MANKRVTHLCADYEGGPITGYMVLCPACGNGHRFNTTPGSNWVGGQKPVWTFNGDLDRPTFSPSMLVRTGPIPLVPAGRSDAGKVYVCHSFVRDGRIEFLGDCTHHLVGQTIPLEPW